MPIKSKTAAGYLDAVAVYVKKATGYVLVGGISNKTASGYATALAGNADGYNPIANRTFVPNDDGGAGNRYIKAKTTHIVYRDVRTKKIRVKWPNWRSSTGGGSVIGGGSEVLTTGTATGTASISYYDYATGTLTEVNLLNDTGGTTLSAAPGNDLVGYATINCKAFTRIFPKLCADFPGGMVFSQKRADLTNGDRFQFGGTALTLAGDPTQSYDTAWYGPSMIEVQDAPGVSVGLIEDSRGTALADVPNTAFGGSGAWSRALEQRCAVVNVSIPGETAADFALLTQSPRRLEYLKRAGKLAFGLGVNDVIFNSRTLAQLQANLSTIEGSVGRGYAMLKTINPVTNSGTNTITNATRDPVRQAYNTWARARTGTLDTAITLENGATGTWNAAYVPPDGTHETNVANQISVAQSGFTYHPSGIPAGVVLVSAFSRKLILDTSAFRLLLANKADVSERVIRNLDSTNSFQIAFADKNNNDRNIPGSGWTTVGPNEEFFDTTGFQAYVRLPSATAAVLIEIETRQQVS